jgi:predicted SAM-dependent methyltransferase
MKLHLGCGQRYFEGYVNIDYPLTEHSVQKNSVADQFANLLELNYPSGSIAEVRLHHVFEHFTRTQAAALLASWNSWLEDGGSLHIEVPDFGRTASAVLSPFAGKAARYVGLRHIFGSQEAHWAVHYEGYTKKTLSVMMKHFGFDVKKVIQSKYLDTYNLEIIAVKHHALTKKDAIKKAGAFLQKYLVADVPSEQELLRIWQNDFQQQLEKTFAV